MEISSLWPHDPRDDMEPTRYLCVAGCRYKGGARKMSCSPTANSFYYVLDSKTVEFMSRHSICPPELGQGKSSCAGARAQSRNRSQLKRARGVPVTMVPPIGFKPVLSRREIHYQNVARKKRSGYSDRCRNESGRSRQAQRIGAFLATSVGRVEGARRRSLRRSVGIRLQDTARVAGGDGDRRRHGFFRTVEGDIFRHGCRDRQKRLAFQTGGESGQSDPLLSERQAVRGHRSGKHVSCASPRNNQHSLVVK